MNKLLSAILCIACVCPGAILSSADELYIVTDGPVAVGGGMVRYYTTSGDQEALRSLRYSYHGLAENSVIVKKTVTVKKEGSHCSTEIMNIPLVSKQAALEIGPHLIKLKVNEYGRVLVEKAGEK
ncbi:MAG: hypothetical protein GF408_04335 [Candidatus Omnitrophica bacterium]|nr:hypothetical protein [Candidatus Omnitrophota bacterium]